jgi:hypothetical protein
MSTPNRNSVSFYPSWMAKTMTIKDYQESGAVRLVTVNTIPLIPLNVDQTLLSYEKLHAPDCFQRAQQQLHQLEERKKEIEELRRLRQFVEAAREEEKKIIQEEMKQANQQAQVRKKQQDEEAKRKQLEDAKKHETIQQMMRICEGLNDPNTARFYLESQQWHLEEAVSLYCGSTGKKDLRKKESFINLKIQLPDKTTITHKFEAKSLMWSLLQVVYQAIQSDREFAVSMVEGRNDIPIDVMTNTSFEQAGIPNNAVLYVRFI